MAILLSLSGFQSLSLCLSVLLGVLGYLYLYKIAEKRRSRMFEERKPMTKGEWKYECFPEYDSCFENNILDIAGIISECIGVDLTKLRPTDTLYDDLSFNKWYLIEDSLELIQEEINEYAKKEIIWNSEWKTVRDLINGVLKQLP